MCIRDRYNKANPLKSWKMMGRMHDKYLIADGKRYILGGRNTYNYFLGDFPGHKNYCLLYTSRTQRFYDLEIENFNEENILVGLLSAVCKARTCSFEEVVRIVLTVDVYKRQATSCRWHWEIPENPMFTRWMMCCNSWQVTPGCT